MSHFMMSYPINNLFHNLPTSAQCEVFDTLLQHKQVKIERIVSKGQASLAEEWYDQAQAEWVILLAGNARLQFAKDKAIISLTAGDYIFIPAHEKHRVDWTDPATESVWLAIHLYENPHD
jgi:cupin 2 domain-containing protein